MKIKNREAVIVGVADAPLVKGALAGGGTVLSLQARVAKEAVEAAGLSMKDVDGLLVSGIWGLPGPGMLMSITVGEYLGIQPRYTECTNIGGSVFELLVARAKDAIESAQCEVAIVLYGSTQKSDGFKFNVPRPPHFNMQYESPYGMPAPMGGYAMAAKRHMHEYGTTSEQLAEIAVAARQWAALNPVATMRDPITVADVLASPMISDPLHLMDSCLITDGGGCVVLTTAERARDLKKKPIRILGHGESHTHWHIAQMPDLARLSAAEAAGAEAFRMAGMTPADIDVAQLYDSFTITVLLTLEALGFCKRGEGGDFVSGGRIAPGGAFPLNTSGGGLANAHPGMLGLYLLIEAARQLWGEAGDRQVAGARTALCHGTGGTLSSGATCILSVEGS